MLQSRKLLLTVLLISNLHLMKGFEFQAFAGETKENLNIMNFWDGEHDVYVISFEFAAYDFKTQAPSESEDSMIMVGDGADAGTLGTLSITCREATFSSISEIDGKVHLGLTQKAVVADLENNYEVPDDKDYNYTDGNDLWTMTEKANIWMKEKCAGDDYQILEIDQFGGPSMTITLNPNLVVMLGPPN